MKAPSEVTSPHAKSEFCQNLVYLDQNAFKKTIEDNVAFEIQKRFLIFFIFIYIYFFIL